MVPVVDPLPRVFRRYLPHAFPARLLLLLLFVPAVAPAAQDDVQIFPQLGHPEYIGAIAISPDGRTVVTGSADKTLKLWDVASGRELRTLSGHTWGITTVAISPDGRIIASGSHDNTIKLWDMATGRELRTIETEWVRTVAFSSDGRTVAAAVWERRYGVEYFVKFWDVATGRELRRVKTQTQADAFAISPDGRTVVTGSVDNILKLWDVASGRELRILGRNWVKYPIAFSSNGRTAASVVSADKKRDPGGYSSVNLALKLWDIASGRELRALRLGWVDYTTLAFSPDGRAVAAEKVTRVEHGVIRYKTIRLWDVASGRELRTLSGSEYGPGHMDRVGYTAFVFSPDGRTVAAAKKDRTLRLWDVASGRELQAFTSHSHGVARIAMSPDGRTVASGYQDGTLKLWDVVSGRVRHALAGHKRPNSEGPVDDIAFSLDGRTVVSASNGNRTLKSWDVATGRELRGFENFEFFLERIALSPDARSMVTGSMNKPLKIWDVESGRDIRTLVERLWTDIVAFSPDGRIVASSHQLDRGDNKYVIKLWDAASGRELQALTGHPYAIHHVAVSPDGRTVASADGDRNLKLWDVVSGRELRSLNKGYDTDYVRALVFSPDGRTLVSGHLDKTLKFWDVATGSKFRTLSGHASRVNSIAFSPDGRTLASGSEDGAVKLWDLATGKEKASFVNFKDGEWIAITPEGYYDASEKGDRYLNVRVGGKVYGVDQYREKFYRPDLVKLALAGQSLTGLASIQAVKPAPSVAVVDTPSSVGTDEATVKVRVADAGGGVGDVRLYLNGAAVVLDRTRTLAVAARPSGPAQVFAYKVRLVSGKNSVRAIAFNAENSMQSTDAVHEIEAKFAARKPSLHALVIGIQEYENPKLMLKYPVADAKLVVATIRERAAGLFERIEITELTTRAATTKDSLLRTVKEFQGRVRPDDLFVFYVASHGTVDEGEYYLITSNVGSVSTQALKRDAVSQDDLKALIANVPATKKLVVIDTCNAGKLGEAIQVAMLTRGMNEETAIKILSRAVGSTILSASSSVQEALEGYEGHGLFTYVVTEGLRGLADLNKDGAVNTLELATYVDDRVPALAEKVFKHKQYPLVSPSGQGFPVTRATVR